MVKETINPYAIYVYSDASMDYDSNNTGGVGIRIVFPDSLNMEPITISIGKYHGANIERLELEGTIQGMNEVLSLFNNEGDKLKNVQTIIFKTDRLSLNDNDKTNSFRIRDWRKNKWCNHEGKPIKNSDLLDKLDKTRKKIIDNTYCKVEIRYVRSKFNKVADKLAASAKKKAIANKNIALNGIKLGKRKHDNIEVDYKLLEENIDYIVHVYKKVPVQNQWEISVEFHEGRFLGQTLKIYSDFETESLLHRHHIYKIRIQNICTYHVNICNAIEEVCYDI